MISVSCWLLKLPELLGNTFAAGPVGTKSCITALGPAAKRVVAHARARACVHARSCAEGVRQPQAGDWASAGPRIWTRLARVDWSSNGPETTGSRLAEHGVGRVCTGRLGWRRERERGARQLRAEMQRARTPQQRAPDCLFRQAIQTRTALLTSPSWHRTTNRAAAAAGRQFLLARPHVPARIPPALSNA